MISAHFTADFSSFATALSKAEVKLKSFEDGAKNVDRTLSRMGNQFSGVKIVQDALAMEKAIAEIGGAAALTESELRKMGAVAGEALAKIEKQRAAGIKIDVSDADVAKLQGLAKAAEPIPEKLTLSAKAANLAQSAFGQMFAAFSASALIDKAVGAIVNLATESFAAAGELDDLSASTGLSTDTLQEMQYVAEQSGSSLDAMTAAAFALQQKIGGGSTSVNAALKELGLSLAEMQRLNPDEQWNRTVAALSRVEDQGRRTTLGVTVMGKGFAGVAAGIASDYDKTADAASKASREQIEALARAGDAWDRLKRTASTAVTSIEGSVALSIEGARKLGFSFTAVKLALAGALTGPEGVIKAFAAVGDGFAKAERAAADHAASTKKSTDVLIPYAKVLADAQAVVKGLTAAERAEIDAAIAVNASQAELTRLFKGNEEAISVYTSGVKSHGEAQKKAAKDLAASIKAQTDLADTIGDVVDQLLLAGDLTDKEFAKQFTDDVEKARLALERLGITGEYVPQILVAASERINRVKLGEMIAAGAAQGIDELNRIVAEGEKATRAAAEARGKGLLANLSGQADALGSILRLNMSESEKQIDDIMRARDAALAGLDKKGSGYGAAASAINASADAAIADTTRKQKEAAQAAQISWGNSWAKIAGGMPAQLQKAFTGGGGLKGFGQAMTSQMGEMASTNLFAAGGALNGLANSMTKGVSNLFGKGIGDAFAMALPGIGALAGPAIQGLTKVFGKLFGGEGRETKKKRGEFLEQFGGEAEFRKLAQQAGVADAALSKMFSTKKVKDFEAAAKQATDQINRFTEEQAADAERLESAIQRYGFSFEELGAKVQQSKLTEQAKELIEDWRVLVGAGIQVETVNSKMADSINEYLQTALRVGAEIPSAMKPILQSMVDQGTLTDAAGNKITDLKAAGITFSQTMTEGFDRIVQKLNELIDKIGGVGSAINNIPNVERDVVVNYKYNDPGPPSYGNAVLPESYYGAAYGGNVLGFAKGTGGRYLDFGAGTPAMLHGRERIVTEGEAAGAEGALAQVAGAIVALQTSMSRAIRENAIQMRDQALITRGAIA